LKTVTNSEHLIYLSALNALPEKLFFVKLNTHCLICNIKIAYEFSPPPHEKEKFWQILLQSKPNVQENKM